MNSFKFFLMSVAVVLFAAGACNKDDDTTTTTSPEIVVDTTEFEVNSASSTLIIEYEVNNAVDGEELTATAGDDWLETELGDGTVTLYIYENTTKEDRSATVTLSYSEADDVIITVTQVIPVIVVESEVSVDYENGSTATFSYSISNAVEGDIVTATPDNDVVANASVNNGSSTVTVTVNENSDYEARTGTVTLSSTYAKDLEVSVVQVAAPFPAGYSDFIGTWTVTDTYYQVATITISQNISGSSYTVSGWQFDGRYTDFTELGFNTSSSLDFTAYYNSYTGELYFYSVDFGTTTYDYNETTLSGNLQLLGGIYSESNSNGTVLIQDNSSYLIASINLSNPSSGSITGAQYGSDDIISMEYGFMISYPTEYSTKYMSFSLNFGNFFPCTISKVESGTASISSVNSLEKAVPVLNEKK